jgi:hypothetical protein
MQPLQESVTDAPMQPFYDLGFRRPKSLYNHSESNNLCGNWNGLRWSPLYNYYNDLGSGPLYSHYNGLAFCHVHNHYSGLIRAAAHPL